jgi:L-alanine-DL-glutamate epimerase-like enolase superfamily enzyme
MKITDLKTYTAFFNWRNWLLVRLYTDEGITGIGEATLAGKAKTVETAIHELGRYIVGKDPFGIERHWEAIDYFQNLYTRHEYGSSQSLYLSTLNLEVLQFLPLMCKQQARRSSTTNL